jgi:hypothetical protein
MLGILETILNKLLFLKIALAGGTEGRTGGGITITLIDPLKCKLPGYEGFGCVAQAIINALFYISIPLVSVMVLIGGFQILTAAGDEEKFKTGRKTITYAVVGFAIIILGLGAVSLIRQLLGA